MEKEEIEGEILKVYLKMELDKKHKTNPRGASLEFDEHEDPAARQGQWYVEDEILKVFVTDASLESSLKTLATKFAWHSVTKSKYSLGMLLILGLTLSPIFLWSLGMQYILLGVVSAIAFISLPFVGYWAIKGYNLEEAHIKFQMIETRVFTGDEEVEKYFRSLSPGILSNRMWALSLIAAEILNLGLMVICLGFI